jgi:di/tricarboxylate transporter
MNKRQIRGIVALSLMICIIRSFIPTTTAVVALLAPMLIEASYGLNTNSLALLLILAFWTASALLIVYTEPIFLITYGNHYYKGKDLVKAGFIPCIVLSFVTALAIPAIVSFLQLG